ncbi:MAG: DMT family transporter [Alphaproteobacteria bacterium]
MSGNSIQTARKDATAYWLALPDNVRGAVWMMVSGVLFTAMGSLVKDLGHRYDPFQVAFFRCLFGFAVLLPLILPHGLQAFRTKRLGMHFARALIGVCAMFCMFYGLANLPLADVTAIGFGLPLFLIVMAVLFLGETVRWRRWTATAIGFVGVIVMLRPGQGTIEVASLVVVAGTMFVSVSATLVKILTRSESTLTSLAWFGVVSTSAISIPAALVWQAPTLLDWGLLILVGALGAAGQACVVRAYTVGEATAVAPFDYIKMIYAVAVGIVVFGEWPDEWTLTGGLIIVGSTLYIARREARLSESQRVALPREQDSGSAHHPG